MRRLTAVLLLSLALAGCKSDPARDAADRTTWASVAPVYSNCVTNHLGLQADSARLKLKLRVLESWKQRIDGYGGTTAEGQ